MHLLSDKNLLLYVIYKFVYGLYPILPIISLFFLAKNLNFTDIGVVFGAFSISGFLFELPTGYLGDRYGRRLSVISGLVAMSATSLIWTTLSSVLGFAIFAAIWMLGVSLISGSLEAYIYDYLNSKNKTDTYDAVISLAEGVSYFAAALGSIAGAYLFSINTNYPYYLLSFLFLVCIPILLLMAKEEFDQEESLIEEQFQILAGLKLIYNSKILLWITLFIALLFGFYDYFVHSVDKPYILALDVFDVRWLGVFIAITQLSQSAFISQFINLKRRLSGSNLITLCWLMFILGLLGMSLLGSVFGLLAVLLFYLTEPFREAIINSFTQKHIPSKIRATTLSSIKVYQAIFGAIIGLLAGMVFDIMPIRSGYLVAFVYAILVYVSLLAFAKIKNIKIE